MNQDDKGFFFLIVCFLVFVIVVTAGVSYSNYLFTMRQKNCIAAGYEWVHIPNFTEMDCRKAAK